jgi:hypothetical protein
MPELILALILSFAITWGVIAYIKAGYAKLQTGPEMEPPESDRQN